MRLLVLITFILPLGILGSCAVSPAKSKTDPAQKHLLSEDVYLNSAEQERFKVLAERGDADAAMHLALYFSSVVNDDKTARYWYKKAADNGGAWEKGVYRSVLKVMKETEGSSKQE